MSYLLNQKAHSTYDVMNSKTSSIVWNRNLAYAVGLIVTDGCLYPDGRHIAFISNDSDLIETFKDCLKITNKVSLRKSGFTGKLTSFRVQFGNVRLYRWLVGIGLMPNKSKQLNELEVPDSVFFDFLRGHLDGDGSIKRYQDSVYPNSTRLYINFLSASHTHLEWLRNRITQLTNITGTIRPVPGAYSLIFPKKDSIALINRMYYHPDVPCLQRKFCIAREFITSW